MKKIIYLISMLFYFMLNNVSHAIEPEVLENQINVPIKPEVFLGTLNTIVMTANALESGAETAPDVSEACGKRVSENIRDALIDRASFCLKFTTQNYISDSEGKSTDVNITTYVYSSDNSVYSYSWPLKVKYRAVYSNPIGPKIQISPKVECGTLNICNSANTIPITLNNGLSPELTVNFSLDMNNITEDYQANNINYGKNAREFEPRILSNYNIVGEAYTYYTSDSAIPKIRCDNGLARTGSKGCVYVEAPAVFRDIKLSDPAVKSSAEHISDAFNQHYRTPGKFIPEEPGSIYPNRSEAIPLNRLRDYTLRLANRTASINMCKANFGSVSTECGPPSGDPDDPPIACDCDEYPFASTVQGAANPNNDFPASVRKILPSDNRTAGSRLGTFFIQKRVLDGEEFYIDIE